MRVLHVTNYYPPELDGGVQRMVSGLAGLQRDAGHVVAVISGAFEIREDGAVTEDVYQGIPVTRIHRQPDERLSGDLGSERIGAVVEEATRAFTPDVIHLHHWHTLSCDLVRRLSTEHPVVVALHDAYTTCPRFFRRVPGAASLCAPDIPLSNCARCVQPDIGLPLPAMVEMAEQRHMDFAAELRQANAVYAVSDAMRQLILGTPAFEGLAIQVLANGITWQGLEAPPHPTPIPGKLRLANWSGLDPRKGVDLVAAAIDGSARRDAFELHLWGHEVEPGYLDTLRRRHPAVDIHYHGIIDRVEQLNDIAATCDVAAIPSISFEPYGLVTDEALLLGMPTIVGDRGAPMERVGSRGIAIPVDDPAPLRELLEGMLANPAWLDEMRAGTHGARRLSHQLDELLALYQR